MNANKTGDTKQRPFGGARTRVDRGITLNGVVKEKNDDSLRRTMATTTIMATRLTQNTHTHTV